jgi:putative ABC transport system permease protein
MVNDLRLAFRQIGRRPAFSAVAILALAIGLAINTVAFSAVNAFLFKGRAGSDVDGAGRIVPGGVGSDEQGFSWPEYELLAAVTQGALTTAAQDRSTFSWRRTGTTETVWALIASTTSFDIIEARPRAGRLFAPQDAGKPAAVVSERFWREQLSEAPIGTTTLTFNGVETPVVGVLPDSFEGPGGLYAPQLWVPAESRAVWQPSRVESETNLGVGVIGRVATGATIPAINARLQTAAATIARQWPRTHARRTARFELMSEWVPELQAIARASVAGMAAVGLVLVIACFNVTTMLLARGVERQREIGIRAAVGASRWRLLRQQMVEGLVLSGLAGMAAAVVAIWSQDLLSAFAIPISTPQRLNVAPDITVIAFIGAMVVAAGILPALAPAVGAARLDLVRALSAQGHSGCGGRPSRARRALVFLQIAGSTAFLTVAALFVQSFMWTGTVDPGFETERAVVVSVDPSGNGYDTERSRLTIEQMVQRLKGVTGVVDVAVADRLPFYIGFARTMPVGIRDVPCAGGGCPRVVTYSVSANYFRTMGTAMSRGRGFAGSAVATVVVNETFAQQFFPSSDALGQVLSLGDSGRRHEIVGVARNTLQRGFGENPAPALYLPLYLDDYGRGLAIVARTAGDAATMVRPIGEALYEVDPQIAPEVMTMAARLEMPRWPAQAASRFFGVCGALALLLATIGLAAVMSHAVGQRTREFGVRLSIGATGGHLRRDVLASGFRVIVPGVGVGVIGGLLLARAIRSAIVGVNVDDPTTYVGVALLQAAIALGACLLPAYRASRVDPLTALRAE